MVFLDETDTAANTRSSRSSSTATTRVSGTTSHDLQNHDNILHVTPLHSKTHNPMADEGMSTSESDWQTPQHRPASSGPLSADLEAISAPAITNAPSRITEAPRFRSKSSNNTLTSTTNSLLPWNTAAASLEISSDNDNQETKERQDVREMMMNHKIEDDALHLPNSTPVSVIGSSHPAKITTDDLLSQNNSHVKPSLDKVNPSFHPPKMLQGKSPSSVVDPKSNHSTTTTTKAAAVASSPLIPKVQKVLTPITSKVDPKQTSTVIPNTSKQIVVESDKGEQHPKLSSEHYHSTPKRPYASVSEEIFLSPFLPSPEHHSSNRTHSLTTVPSHASASSSTPFKNTLTPSDFKHDLSDSNGTFDGQCSKYHESIFILHGQAF